MTDREYWRASFAKSMAHFIAEWRSAKEWSHPRAATARAWVYHYGRLKRMLS